MKKGIKAVIIILAVIVTGVLALFVAEKVRMSAENHLYEMYGTALSACDIPEAMNYAEKLKREDLVTQVENLRQFADLYEKEKWEEAIRYYDSFGKSAFSGKAAAMYCDCYYRQLIPAAGEALDNGETVKALELLLAFQHRFHDGAGSASIFENGSTYCSYSIYKEYYPDSSQRFFDLICRAGDTAVESRDEEAIGMLSGFDDARRYPRTFRPKDFSWTEKLAAYNREKTTLLNERLSQRKAQRETVFDTEKLKNWNAEALREACGAEDITLFTPSDPQPLTFIVTAKDVIDPRTDAVSAGGYYSKSKICPVDTADLLKNASYIQNSAMTLTDDPEKASFALILTLSYSDSVGSYTFENGYRIPVYNASLSAELLNLATKQSLKSKTVHADPYLELNGRTYIEKNVLESPDCKQLYGPVPTLKVDDFPEYWAFIGQADLDPAYDSSLPKN